MKLEDMMSRLNGTLTAADQRVAAVLLSAPGEAAFLSAHEVARRAGVHPSSAVRFARKLGFGGYPDLQSHLRASILSEAAEAPAPERMRKSLGTIGGKPTLDGLVATEIRALSSLPKQVGAAQLEAAARAVINARRAYVFGQGHGATLAGILARRLKRSGYDSHPFFHLDWQAPEEVQGMAKGDTLIAFVLRRLPPRLPALLDHAREAGATTILIGDLAAAQAESAADHLLVASRGNAGETQTIVVPLTIVNAVILEISRLDSGRSVRSLERREPLRRHFD